MKNTLQTTRLRLFQATGCAAQAQLAHHRAESLRWVMERLYLQEGLSLPQIACWMQGHKFDTARGGKWTPEGVRRVLMQLEIYNQATQDAAVS